MNDKHTTDLNLLTVVRHAYLIESNETTVSVAHYRPDTVRQVGAGLNRDCPLGRMVSERRWRVRGRGRGLFALAVDDGGGFRAATTAEVDAALRQRELFGSGGVSCRRRLQSGW